MPELTSPLTNSPDSTPSLTTSPPPPLLLRPERDHLTRALTEELHRLRKAAESGGARDAGPGLTDVLLRDALRERATDIHLDPQAHGTRVRFRIDGALHDAALLGPEDGTRLVRHLKVVCGMDLANAFKPANARMTQVIDGREVDLRVASAPAVTGE